jgi:hypothetical protein
MEKGSDVFVFTVYIFVSSGDGESIILYNKPSQATMDKFFKRKLNSDELKSKSDIE